MTSQQFLRREDPSAPTRTRRCPLFLLILRGLRRPRSHLAVPPEAAHRTVDTPSLGRGSTPIRLGATRTLLSGNLSSSKTPAWRPASLTPYRSTRSEMTCPRSSPRSFASRSSQGNSSNGNNPTADDAAATRRPSPSRSRSSRLLTSPLSTSSLNRNQGKYHLIIPHPPLVTLMPPPNNPLPVSAESCPKLESTMITLTDTPPGEVDAAHSLAKLMVAARGPLLVAVTKTTRSTRGSPAPRARS